MRGVSCVECSWVRVCFFFLFFFVFFFFFFLFCFLMIRRPPRSTLDRSSAASDVYKRQGYQGIYGPGQSQGNNTIAQYFPDISDANQHFHQNVLIGGNAVSYTHLRAHETVLDLVCRLLLEKKKNNTYSNSNLHKTLITMLAVQYLIHTPLHQHTYPS